jgi:glyoxylase-like metal-dependent hydrolase (beta-lactamase superfamily II)
MLRTLSGALLSLIAACASASSSLESQARAQRVLSEAVAAIGGEAALRGIQSIRRDFVEDWVDVGQGRRPWTGMPRAERLPPHAGFQDSESVSYLDYAGRRYYETVRYADSPGDYAIVADAGTPERSFQTIAYMRERPFFMEHAPEEREKLATPRFRRHPEGVLRAALDRIETLIFLGRVKENGTPLDAIAFADADGAQVRLFFDSANRRLIRSESLRTHRVYGDTTRDTVYADFRRVGVLELPHAFIDRIAGVPVSVNRVRAITLDGAAIESWFRAPAVFAAVAAPPDTPTVEPVGDGVFMIRGAYNLMFAEFRDHVLLVEAPLGEAHASNVLGLVAGTVPGKPVRLVATHFHFDHIGGVRTAVARGIPILTAPDARPVIEQSLASVQLMRPDEFARKPRRATIRTAGRKTVLDDGSQRVELYDFGPSPHVEQILVAYFPRQKLLHVADLFDVLTPELVIAGVDAVVMHQRIREFGLDVERIVPMHGVPVTIEHLRGGLEIRRKYQESAR